VSSVVRFPLYSLSCFWNHFTPSWTSELHLLYQLATSLSSISCELALSFALGLVVHTDEPHSLALL
jgi:hypothetical protein